MKDDKQIECITGLAILYIEQCQKTEHEESLKKLYREEADALRKENQKLTLELAELKSPLKKERFEVF